MSKKIGRPKVKNKRKQLNLTINKDLNKILEKFAEDNNLSKSEYIEYLIKKDIGNEQILSSKIFYIFYTFTKKSKNNEKYYSYSCDLFYPLCKRFF